MGNIDYGEWEKLEEAAVGISGSDIKTIVWRVLGKWCKVWWCFLYIFASNFIDETLKYKGEKYPMKPETKTDGVKVLPVSDSDKEKVKKIKPSSDTQNKE